MNNPLVLLHISDVHVDSDDTKNYHIREKLNKLHLYIDDNEKLTTDKYIILITGDIGNSARVEELNLFTSMLREYKLEDRVIIVPGNHDYCRNGNEIGSITFDEEAVKRFQALQLNLLAKCSGFISTIDTETKLVCSSKVCDPFIKSKILFWNKKSNVKCTARILEYINHKIVFVLLDSNPQNVMFDLNFARGEIGSKQMKVVKDIATNPKYKGWIKIALLHHHPIYNNYFLKLEDSDEFLKITWDTFNIICFGHKHSANIWSNHVGWLTSAPNFSENPFGYKYSIMPNNTILQGEINLG